ncbi:MAG: phosphoglycerate mutase family protein [Acidobacteriota bacterium]|nr:phosphoglycerate mutase family protein [Acidobacteriota bacterium]
MRILLILAGLIGPVFLIAGEPTMVYLVRHAEKVDESRDPDLSQAGLRRSEALAAFLEKVSFDAVYATQFKRTQQTVAPLSKATGLKIQQHDARDSKGFAEMVRGMPGKTIIAAGHSNTVPAIIQALGGPPLTIGDSDYDNLFLVVLVDGKAHLQHFRFKP